MSDADARIKDIRKALNEARHCAIQTVSEIIEARSKMAGTPPLNEVGYEIEDKLHANLGNLAREVAS
jgi:hypothetical protein